MTGHWIKPLTAWLGMCMPLSAYGEFQVTNTPCCAEFRSDVSGDILVFGRWEDLGSGAWLSLGVFGWDRITEQEFPIGSRIAYQAVPVISGNIVAWEDGRNG